MPAPSAHLSPGNHLIVCGATPLAYRLIRELTHRYHESVVVVIPGRLQNHGPRIAAISGITVLERAELTSAALREAGVATARAAAMVGWDDLANFHSALRAQELNPELRIVVGADNRRLGDHITGLLRDCTVLSSSQLAGPALVAAALGEIAPSHVRVTGQTLYVAGRGDVPGDHVLCGLAVTDDPGVAAQLVAPDDVHDDADLVLAVADGTPRDAAARAEFTAIDVIPTRSTAARSLPVIGQLCRCSENTFVSCCYHSFGNSLRAAVCDAGWMRKALNVSATKRTGPSAPSRSQRSQSAENQSASSKPPESTTALRRKTGDGMAMKF